MKSCYWMLTLVWSNFIHHILYSDEVLLLNYVITRVILPQHVLLQHSITTVIKRVVIECSHCCWRVEEKMVITRSRRRSVLFAIIILLAPVNLSARFTVPGIHTTVDENCQLAEIDQDETDTFDFEPDTKTLPYIHSNFSHIRDLSYSSETETFQYDDSSLRR